MTNNELLSMYGRLHYPSIDFFPIHTSNNEFSNNVIPPPSQPVVIKPKSIYTTYFGKKEKIFSQFAFEPTFMPNIVLPKYVFDSKNEYCRIIDTFLNALRRSTFKNKIFRDINRDEESIEVSTGKRSNYIEFRKKLDILVNDFRDNGWLIPSSCISLETEGGCHINFNMEYKSNQYDIMNRLRNYLCFNPSICWMFLSPYDNVSSKIRYKYDITGYQKGDMIIYHEMQNRLELRFFMMPRDMKEFDVHFEFANKLMLYCESNENKLFKSHTPRIKYSQYTYPNMMKEFRQVCKDIGFDYQKVVDCKKLPLVRLRFELGPKHLT